MSGSDFEQLVGSLRRTERRLAEESTAPAGVVDVHTHVLPGVDDGAPDLQQALSMLRCAHGSGTRTVVLTPHMFHRGFPNTDPGEIRSRFAAFRQQVWLEARAGETHLEEMTLALGAENTLSHELLEAAERSAVLTLAGGAHLLVELPDELPTGAIEQAITRLIDLDYVPILAHVERYMARERMSEVLERLVGAGCVAQVNFGSLDTPSSRWHKDAMRLVSVGLATVVASDGHDTGSRSIALRVESLPESIRESARLGTTLFARRLVARPDAAGSVAQFEVPHPG